MRQLLCCSLLLGFLQVLQVQQVGLLVGDAVLALGIRQLLLGPSFLLLLLLRLLLHMLGVRSNRSMSTLVHSSELKSKVLSGAGGFQSRTAYPSRSDASGDELRELSLIGVLILVLQVLHVVGHVLPEDPVAVGLGTVLLLLLVVAVESALTGKENALQ